MYVVPASKRDLPESQFNFGPDNDTQFQIPRVQYLSLEFVEKAQENAAGAQIVDVCTALNLVAAVAYIKTLDAVQLGELTLAWLNGSDVSPGESSASTD